MVAENLDRHLSMAQEWHPHDYVPWSQGRDFAFLGGEDWAPEQSQLSETAKAAMFTNLLTEDNLPSYHREIATRFGRDGAWGTWVGRWTAEENRHGIAMRDYLVVTRGVDPVELERARMDYMTSGYDSGDKTALEAVTYVSFQELATRVSHRNTGKVTGRPDRRPDARPDLQGREPAHGLLPQHRRRGAGDRARRDDAGDRRRGHRLRDAGRHDGGLPAQLDDHREGRDLRPAPAPRRRDHAGAAALARLRPHRLRTGGRAGPRASWRHSSRGSTPRRPSSSTAARRTGPGWPRGPTPTRRPTSPPDR